MALPPRQVRRQLFRAAVTLGWFLGQTLHADGFEVARHFRGELPGRHGLVRKHLEDRVERRRCTKGRPARQTLIQNGAQGIDIRRWSDVLLALCLLGGHVGRRAHHGARLSQPAAQRNTLGQAKVRDTRLALLIEEDVARFEVAVDDTTFVRCLHGVRQPLHQGGRLARRQRSAVELAGQGPAFAVFQREEGQPLVGAEVVHLHDARMLDGGDHLRLRQESRTRPSEPACSPERIILRATRRLSLMCRALYTTPMPPRPNSPSTS